MAQEPEQTTKCDGAWSSVPTIIEVPGADDVIHVFRCSGCWDQMPIFKGRGFGPWPPNVSRAEILRRVVAQSYR